MRRTAHPRAGGENRTIKGIEVFDSGSSPRGRGKPTAVGLRPPAQRLIPARAGKTPCGSAAAKTSAAHPRAGGENVDGVVNLVASPGSSPRGRGKPLAPTGHRRQRRLIPARAGKTVSLMDWLAAQSAHPRAGGENKGYQLSLNGRKGSSPRGRGKLVSLAYDGVRAGLIPARAGKTSSGRRSSSSARAHPRAGGENAVTINGELVSLGSSPRGRGKPTPAPCLPCARGLIPARAGKTRISSVLAVRPTAHPRAGGENMSAGEMLSARRGSSPRGRGKPEGRLDGPEGTRLIPARAGKTAASRPADAWESAHPRAGGENITVPGRATRPVGSSPRGRGKRRTHRRRNVRCRLIPARAGKTQNSRPATRRRGLIPARAGKTSRCTCCICCTMAHPRAGGENRRRRRRETAHLGSSPRGRGKHVRRCHLTGVARLIPARAGKTFLAQL